MKNSRSEQDLDRIRNSEAYLKVQVASQEAELKEKTAKMQHYLRDLEDSRGKHEEALMYLQMQLNSFKTKAEISENELKNMTGKATLLQSHADSSTGALKAHEQEINVLKKQISDHELKYTKLREHTTEVEKNMNMMNLMKAEQDNLYNTFKREAKVAVDAKEELLGKVKELQVENSRLAIEGSEKSEMQQLVTSLKQQIQEQEAQSARWRQEALQNERSHAMKTAMLATAEVHIENLKKELAVKDDTTKEALERVSLLQVRLASAESRLEERILELNAKLDDSKKQEDDLVKRHEVDIASVKEKYDLQIEGIHRDNAKKSSTARILLSEKEEETRVMRERIRDLETEISSGAPSERRIFELASMQAKRDAVHGVQK